MRIKGASHNPFPFLNCKLYHLGNMQIISDSIYHPSNVIATCRKGAHDFFVLQHNKVSMSLAQGDHGDAWLIGKLLYSL